MARIILINKPYNMLSQFTDSSDRETLAAIFGKSNAETAGYYPAGRLDQDSEGLLLLTDDGALQHRIADPKNKLSKTYWVQVEGECNDQAITALRDGVALKDGTTAPAKVTFLATPVLWERPVPVRTRKNIPTHWLEIEITEGKNRQIRRMTAAVNLPTLRLVRVAIGPWRIEKLQPGEFRFEEVHLPRTRKRK
ncbi:23S rRNA pseudouridine2457 synthase [Alteromonadaceae bacterium 2753L.S.0a.02]|nr:23S rRNA pseudouridine2457 synthase [Alteromonadaceae bacterium 2753L.S.0a.02]